MASVFWPGIDTSAPGLSISDAVPVSAESRSAMSAVSSMYTETRETTEKMVPAFISLNGQITANDNDVFPDTVNGVDWRGPSYFEEVQTSDDAGQETAVAGAFMPARHSGIKLATDSAFLEIVGPCDGSHSRSACDAAGASGVCRCRY